jgi:hypothetical protein
MNDRREIGPELVRRVTRVSEVLEENGRLRAEIARLRLTDAERWAVSVAMGIINEGNYGWPDGTTPPQDTLRGLLERLK